MANNPHDPELSPKYRGLDGATYVVFGQPCSLSEAVKTGPVRVGVSCIGCNSFDYGGMIAHPRQDALGAPLRWRRLWRAREIEITADCSDDLGAGAGLA